MSIPRMGEAAPDFTLPSTDGSVVTLSTFRDQQPVLLAFFPLAFTSTCTAEICAFSDDYAQFADRGVVVFPVSVDSVPSLKAFKRQEGSRVEMLSDFKRVVSRRYGVLDEEKFQAKRSYFLIDREGILRWSWVEEQNGLRRENAELIARIEALR